jgi:hypothetical protein
MSQFEIRRAVNCAWGWTVFAVVCWFLFGIGSLESIIEPVPAKIALAILRLFAVLPAAYGAWMAVHAWRYVWNRTVWVFSGDVGKHDPGGIRPNLARYFEQNRFGTDYRAEVWAPGFILVGRDGTRLRRACPSRIAAGISGFVGERRLTSAERRELLGHVWAMVLGVLWLAFLTSVGVSAALESGSGSLMQLFWWFGSATLALCALIALVKTARFVLDLIRGKCRRTLGSDFVYLLASKAAWMEKGRPAAWRERTKWTLDPPPGAWSRLG